MENPELLLLELDEFNKKTDQDDRIPQNLENFIESVSKTGIYIFPWATVRKLYLKKLNNVISNLPSSLSTSGIENLNNSSFSLNTTSNAESSNIQLIKERIMERMQSFTSAPFTIQRISELLLKPSNHYNRVDKYLRGLEKCIMVVTTVDPHGSKIFIELNLTNGIASNSPSPAATPTRPFTPISQFNEPTSLALTLNQPLINENTPPPTKTTTTTITTTTTTTEMNINMEENVKISIDEEEKVIVSNEEIAMVISEKTDEQVVVEEEVEKTTTTTPATLVAVEQPTEENEVVNIIVDNLNEQQTTE